MEDVYTDDMNMLVFQHCRFVPPDTNTTFGKGKHIVATTEGSFLGCWAARDECLDGTAIRNPLCHLSVGQQHLDRFEQQAHFVEATIDLLNRLRDVSQAPPDVDKCNSGLPSANNAESSASKDPFPVPFVPASSPSTPCRTRAIEPTRSRTN